MTFSEYISSFGLEVTDEQDASLKEIGHAVHALNPYANYQDLITALEQQNHHIQEGARAVLEAWAAMEAFDKSLPWYTRLWLRTSIRFDHYQMLFWDWFYGWEA